MNKAFMAAKIADYLTKNHDQNPVMRLLGISGGLGLYGRELKNVLESIKLIHVASSVGGLNVLLPQEAGLDGIMAEVKPYLESFHEDLNPEHVRELLGRGGMEELMANGAFAPIGTNFGGMVIHALAMTALAAIEEWHLPRKKEDESWRKKDKDFVRINNEVFARLRADSIFAALPDEELRDLAWQMTKKIDKLEILQPMPDLFEIAGWLDACEKEPELEFGQYLKRIKSPNLEKEVIWNRTGWLNAEKAFAHPEWPKVRDALLEREEKDPMGGNGWEPEHLLWDALARECWDIFREHSYIVPDWPDAAELAKVFNDRESCRMNFGTLGPNAIRHMRIFNFNVDEYERFRISPLGWRLLGIKFGGPRAQFWWDCKAGKVIVEDGDAKLADALMEKLLALD